MQTNFNVGDLIEINANGVRLYIKRIEKHSDFDILHLGIVTELTSIKSDLKLITKIK